MKKLLFDFFPLILFFVALKFGDIYLATWAAMGAAVADGAGAAPGTGVASAAADALATTPARAVGASCGSRWACA